MTINMTTDRTTDATAVEHFLHGQVACWNAGDKDGFFAHYRALAPAGLSIEYVGHASQQPDAWLMLEGMWMQQNSKFRIEVKACIVNGNEAACHHRNALRDGEGNSDGIETIELYRFFDGRLEVRYFISK